MAKVYVVTSGDYSDYHVSAAFSTRDAADTYAALNNHPREQWYETYRVEEFDLDTPIERPTTGAYIVELWHDGDIDHSHFDAAGDPRQPAIVLPLSYNPEAPPDPEGRHRYRGYGKSVEHARRSAEELRRVTLTEPPMVEP